MCIHNVLFSTADHVIINIISRNEGFIILYLLIVYVSVLRNYIIFHIIYILYSRFLILYNK